MDKMPEAGTDTSSLTSDLNLILAGDPERVERACPKLARELEKLANARLRPYRKNVSIDAQSLWGDLYLQLPKLQIPPFKNRGHFFKFASRWMRFRIIDLARARLAEKRGAGAVRTTLSGVEVQAPDRVFDVLMVEEALSRLRKVDACSAEIVEMRFFGGFAVPEMSEALDLSVPEIYRRLDAALRWLAGHLERKAQTKRAGAG